MRKKMLTACGAFFVAVGAMHAQQAEEVKLVLHFNDGSEPQEELLSAVHKITFADNDFTLVKNEEEMLKFDYAKVRKITFSGDFGSIEQVGTTAEELVLYPNPASDFVNLKNWDNAHPAKLMIFSIDGQCRMVIDEWNGEAVNVQSLAQGIYLLNVNNKTYKFRKL